MTKSTDVAGDVSNYAITVQNTFIATLPGPPITTLFPYTTLFRSGTDVVGNNDNVLDVGETWSYTAAHTVRSEEHTSEVKSHRNSVGKHDSLRNVATAHSNQTPDDTDDAVAPVTRSPSFNIVKAVS